MTLAPAVGHENEPFWERPKCDVVIVTYHSAAHIARCLESLNANTRLGSVVVVDNGSTDNTPNIVTEVIAQLPHAVTMLPLGVNLGFGTAANRGMASTTNPYVCLLNADTVVDPFAIDSLATYLDAHPQCAAVGPQVRNPDGSNYPSARSFPSPLTAAGHALVGLVWKDNPWSRRYLATDLNFPDWISGTAMLLRRSAVESVGGFDEQYFMYVEDLDLCWRLRDVGFEIGFCPDAGIMHEVGGSSQAAPYKLIVAHHRSAWRFARKSSSGLARALLPAYGAALGLRMVLALGQKRFRGRRA